MKVRVSKRQGVSQRTKRETVKDTLFDIIKGSHAYL